MNNDETSEESRLDVQEEKKVEVVEHRVFNESMSDTVGKLAAAMANAQGACTNASKDKQGYGYKYVTLANLIEIAREPLSKNGIAIIQSHELIKGETPLVVTHTTIMHSSGEWFKSSIELPIKVMPQLSAAQMAGVVMTYGRRYALQSICLIAAEEDSDGTVKE